MQFVTWEKYACRLLVNAAALELSGNCLILLAYGPMAQLQLIAYTARIFLLEDLFFLCLCSHPVNR